MEQSIASASTYGWFLAYVSKGQRVFYNQVAIQERVKHELVHEDFFLPTWTSLQLVNATHVEVYKPENRTRRSG